MSKQLNEADPIFVNIPCPKKDEAIKLCGGILQKRRQISKKSFR